MQALARAAFVTGLASVGTILVGVLRTKLLAVLLGPYGVGVVAQVMGFLSVANYVVSLGMANAVTKYVAEFRTSGTDEDVEDVVSSARALLLLVSGIAVVGSLVFARHLADLVFGDAALWPFLVIAAIGIPFVVLGNLEKAFLQGYKDIKAVALVGVLPSILGLLVVVPLLLWWGTQGAVVHVAIFFSLSWVVATVAFHRYSTGRRILRWGIRLPVVAILLRFGAVALLTTSAEALSLLLARSLIIEHLGMEQNGIYQAVFGMSQQYLTIVLASMSTYSYARLSELKEHKDIVAELNDTLRLALMMVTPIIVLLLVARPLVLRVLFSAEFLPAGQLMPLQLAGDFLKVTVWGGGLSLLPMARLRAFAAMNLGWDVAFLGLATVLLPVVGLMGVVAAYAVGFGAQAVATYVYQRRTIGFRLASGNRRLLLGSMAAVAVAIALPDGSALGLAGAGLALATWVWLAVGLDQVKEVTMAVLPTVRAGLARSGGNWFRGKVDGPMEKASNETD